jgi:mono/diheme cytochrome c family protein
MTISSRTAAAALLLGAILAGPAPGLAAENPDGRALLERHCGRCHALSADTQSPLAKAPNLAIVLESYPEERLEFELAEGIGSRHPDMPQVQFTAEEIAAIKHHLHPDGGAD